MQNSRVIRRVNASLARCLSHHRRLCRDIDELDRLLFNDEFLRDPRTQWLLQNRHHKEVAAEGVDLTSSEELKRSQRRLRENLSGGEREFTFWYKQSLSFFLAGSSSDSEDDFQRRRRNSTYLIPTPRKRG